EATIFSRFINGEEVCYLTHNNCFLKAVNGGNSIIKADAVNLGPWERFKIINKGDSRISLETSSSICTSSNEDTNLRCFFYAENGGGDSLTSSGIQPEAWETFEVVPT
ncbi:MAG: hypothetical protein AAFY30_14720, partial [Cyanobacteria bacterium J06642_12]